MSSEKPVGFFNISMIQRWRSRLLAIGSRYVGKLIDSELVVSLANDFYKAIDNTPKSSCTLSAVYPISNLYKRIETTVRDVTVGHDILSIDVLKYLVNLVAGNINKIRAECFVIRPWVYQLEDEWVLALIREATNTVLYEKDGIMCGVDIMSGSPAGKTFSLFLPSRVVGIFWSICRHARKYIEPYSKELIGLFILLKLKGNSSDFKAIEWNTTSSIEKRNKLRIKLRANTGKICKRQPHGCCFTCYKTYNECPLSIALNKCVEKRCPMCKKVSVFSINSIIWQESICLFCQYNVWKQQQGL